MKRTITTFEIIEIALVVILAAILLIFLTDIGFSERFNNTITPVITIITGTAIFFTLWENKKSNNLIASNVIYQEERLRLDEFLKKDRESLNTKPITILDSRYDIFNYVTIVNVPTLLNQILTDENMLKIRDEIMALSESGISDPKNYIIKNKPEWFATGMMFEELLSVIDQFKDYYRDLLRTIRNILDNPLLVTVHKDLLMRDIVDLLFTYHLFIDQFIRNKQDAISLYAFNDKKELYFPQISSGFFPMNITEISDLRNEVGHLTNLRIEPV